MKPSCSPWAPLTLRGVSTGRTAGLANPFLSLLEDALCSFIAVLAFLVPLLAVLFVVAGAWFTWRWLGRRGATALLGVARCAVASRRRLGVDVSES